MTAGVAVAAAPARAGRDAAWWLSAACVVGSVLAVAAVALVVAVHVDDRYAVDHASGARIALARHAAHGVLYPPLVAADSVGGTRFMPLPVLLHAGLSRLTGEYLVSGKLLALAAMLAVGLVMFLVLRRRGCPLPLSAGLVGVVLTTQTGLLAVTGLRGDSLPLLLQLLAVAAAADRARGERPGPPRRWPRWPSPPSCTRCGRRPRSCSGSGPSTGVARGSSWPRTRESPCSCWRS